jgi:hypothetical protein
VDQVTWHDCDVIIRARCIRKDRKSRRDQHGETHRQQDTRRRLPSYPSQVLVIDVETVTPETSGQPECAGWSGAERPEGQPLLFGTALIGSLVVDAQGTTVITVSEEIVFYPDDLPPAAVALLDAGLAAPLAAPADSRLVTEHERYVTRRLLPLSRFLREVFWPLYGHHSGCLITGFNLPFDISRLATRWRAGRREHIRQWQLQLGDDERYPLITIKKLGPGKYRFSSAWIDQQRAWFRRGMTRSRFLDLLTLDAALGDGSRRSLQKACAEYLPGVSLDKDVEHGRISIPYTVYNRTDAWAAVRLCERLLNEFHRHPVASINGGVLSPWNAFSPASVGKAYLTLMGIQAPAMSSRDIALVMPAFYGGWVECMGRGIFPVCGLDFTKMYQTQYVLQGLQRFLLAERLELREGDVEDVQDVRNFLEEITADDLFRPDIWRRLQVLCEVEPHGEILPVRAKFSTQQPSIGVVPFEGGGAPFLYWLHDLVLAKLLGGRAPHLLRVWRVHAEGRQKTVRVRMIDGSVLDPESDDIFKWNVEWSAQIKRKMKEARTDAERENLSRLYRFAKTFGNATSYGITVELNDEMHAEDDARPVVLEAGDRFRAAGLSTKPEEPGRYFCPVIGGCITAGARLLLALLHVEVGRRGGLVLAGDTDSAFVIARPEGGPCPYIERRNGPDGRLIRRERTVHALSSSDIQDIIQRFSLLVPYDRSLFPGSLLEVKSRFDDAPDGIVMMALLANKRYCLFSTTDTGLSVHEGKEFVIGSYLPPAGMSKQDAIRLFWELVVDTLQEGGRCEDSEAMEVHRFLASPAVHQVTLSLPYQAHLVLPALLPDAHVPDGDWFPDTVRPFTFVLMGNGVTEDGQAETVITAFTRDPAEWKKPSRWRSTQSDRPAVNLKRWDDLLIQFLRRTPDDVVWPDTGLVPAPGEFGLFTRRPVRARRLLLGLKEMTMEMNEFAGMPPHLVPNKSGLEFTLPACIAQVPERPDPDLPELRWRLKTISAAGLDMLLDGQVSPDACQAIVERGDAAMLRDILAGISGRSWSVSEIVDWMRRKQGHVCTAVHTALLQRYQEVGSRSKLATILGIPTGSLARWLASGFGSFDAALRCWRALGEPALPEGGNELCL